MTLALRGRRGAGEQGGQAGAGGRPTTAEEIEAGLTPAIV